MQSKRLGRFYSYCIPERQKKIPLLPKGQDRTRETILPIQEAFCPTRKNKTFNEYWTTLLNITGALIFSQSENVKIHRMLLAFRIILLNRVMIMILTARMAFKWKLPRILSILIGTLLNPSTVNNVTGSFVDLSWIKTNGKKLNRRKSCKY